MKTYHTENFFVGFDEVGGGAHYRGTIFYKSFPFSRIWKNPDCHLPRKNAGKWSINRDELALMCDFPDDCSDFDSIEKLLEFCEKWTTENITRIEHVVDSKT